MAKEKTTGSNIFMSSDSIPCDSHDSPKPTTTVPTPKAPLPAAPVPTFKPTIGLTGATIPEVLVPQSQSPVPTSQPEIEAAIEAPKNRHPEHASPVEDSLKDPNRLDLLEDPPSDPKSPRYLAEDSLSHPSRLQEPFEDSSNDPDRLQATVEDSLKDPNHLQAPAEKAQDDQDLSELGLAVETKVAQQSSRSASQAPEVHNSSAPPAAEPTAFKMPPKVSGKSAVVPSMAPRPSGAKSKASHHEPASKPKASGPEYVLADVTAPTAASSKQKLQEMREERGAAMSQISKQNPNGAPQKLHTSLVDPKTAGNLGGNGIAKPSVSAGTFKPPASVSELSSRTSAFIANPSKQPVPSRQQTKATTSQSTAIAKPAASKQTAVSKTSSRPQDVKQAPAPAKKNAGAPAAVMRQTAVVQAKSNVVAPHAISSTAQVKSGSLSSVKKPPSKAGNVLVSTKVTNIKQKVAGAADGNADFEVPTSPPHKKPARPRKSQAALPKPKGAPAKAKNATAAKAPKDVIDHDDYESSDYDEGDENDEGYHSKPAKVPTAGARNTRASRRSELLVELDQHNKTGPQRHTEKEVKQILGNEDGVQERLITQGLSKEAKVVPRLKTNGEASLPQGHQDESIEDFEQSMTNIHDTIDAETARFNELQDHKPPNLPLAQAEAIIQTRMKTTTVLVNGTHTASQEPKTGKTQDDPVVLSETPSGGSHLSYISSDKGEEVAEYGEESNLSTKKPLPYTPFRSSPPVRRQKDAQERGSLTEKDLRTAERKDAIQKPHIIAFDKHGPKNQGTLPTKDSSWSSIQKRSLDASKYDNILNAPRQSLRTNIALDAMQDILTGSVKGQRNSPTHGDTTLADDDTAQYHAEEGEPLTTFGFRRDDGPARIAQETAEEEPEQGEPTVDAGEGVVHEQGQPFSDSDHGGPSARPGYQEPSARSGRALSAVSMPPPKPGSKLEKISSEGDGKRQIVGDRKMHPMSQFPENPEDFKPQSANSAPRVATLRPGPPAILLTAQPEHNVVQSAAGYKRSSPLDNEREKKVLPVKRLKISAEEPEIISPTMRTKAVVVDNLQPIPANHTRTLAPERKAGVGNGEPHMPTEPSEPPLRATKTLDNRQKPSLGNSMLIPTKQQSSARSQQRALTALGLTQAQKEPQNLRRGTTAQAVKEKHHVPGNHEVPRKSEQNNNRFNHVPVIASIPKPTAAPAGAVRKEHASTQQIARAQPPARVAPPAKIRTDDSIQEVPLKKDSSLAPPPPPVAVSMPAKAGIKRHTNAIHDEPSKRTRVARFDESQPPLHDLFSGKVNPPRRLPQRRITEEGSPVRSEQEQVYSQQQYSEAVSDNDITASETHSAYLQGVPTEDAAKKKDSKGRFDTGAEGGMLVDGATAFVHDEDIVSEIISRLAEGGEQSQDTSDVGFSHDSDGDVVTNIDPLTHAEGDPFVSTQEEKEAENDQAQANGHSFLSLLKSNARQKAQAQAEPVDNDDDIEQEVEDEGDEDAEDPDKTLVEEDYAFMQDQNDDGSSQSSEEPDGRKVQFAEGFEERMRTLRPYQHDFHHGLFRLAHELSRHLIKAEDTILDLVQDYHKDCVTMIEETESSHRFKLAEFFDNASKKQDNLSEGFEAAARKLDNEMSKVELSREEYFKTRKGKKNPVGELDRLLQGVV